MNHLKSDRVGEKNYNTFGSLMCITKYNNGSNMDVYFPEYKWTFYNAAYKDFKNGHIKCPYEPRCVNIGYLGEGPYKVMLDPKTKTKTFKLWSSMLHRCYDGKVKAYDNCEVCNEWLNYQNFAEWVNNNYYQIDGEVMCLDKDILIKNNQIYRPEACIFVPEKINTFFTKRAIRDKLPIGVRYVNGKYVSRCTNIDRKRLQLGRFDTPEEAFYAYKIFKEGVIRQLAEEYKNKIPKKLYKAMIIYKIEIDD